MADLIERDALKRKHCDTCTCKSNCMGNSCKVYEARCLIADLPAIEAKPVKHGEWIELPKALNPEETPCKCSSCGHILSFYGHYKKSNFCPNCGADMRGEGKEEKSLRRSERRMDHDFRNS